MSFITLTYNDECLSYDGSGSPILVKKHVQDFFKRLRRKVDYHNKNKNKTKIKYFVSGEYGDDFGRPHYHAIVFGIYPTDLQFYKKTRQGFKLYNSKELDDIWKKGRVIFGHVTRESIQYTISYIFKIDSKSEHKVWSLKSSGIGLDYLEKNRHRILKEMSVKIDGKKVGLPRYYKKKLELNPYDIISHQLEHDQKEIEIQRRIAKGEDTYFLRRQDIEMKAKTKIAKIEMSGSRRIVTNKIADPKLIKK